MTTQKYPRSTRLVGEARTALAVKVHVDYCAGASIREIAEETGRSYGSVHALLVEMGTELRGRGGSNRRRS